MWRQRQCFSGDNRSVKPIESERGRCSVRIHVYDRDFSLGGRVFRGERQDKLSDRSDGTCAIEIGQHIIPIQEEACQPRSTTCSLYPTVEVAGSENICEDFC